jgi:hypothetical protein
MKTSIRVLVVMVILGLAFDGLSQDKVSGKANSREQKLSEAGKIPTKDTSSEPSYSYEFNQPDFYTSHILIEHNAQGHGQVSFKRRNSDELLIEPLELSSQTLSRIISSWDALHFLDSEAGYQAPKDFSHLGTIALQMKKGTRSRKTEFNWTHDPHAKALVDEYRRISNQIIWVFDVKLARDNLPLETPKLIESLESLLNRNEITDPRQLTAFLRELSTDERVPLIGRNKAGKLLKKIEK